MVSYTIIRYKNTEIMFCFILNLLSLQLDMLSGGTTEHFQIYSIE